MPNVFTRRGVLPVLVATASAPIVVTRLRAETVSPRAMAPPPSPQGYGNCSQCRCPNFTGTSNICNNCGHNYQTHW